MVNEREEKYESQDEDEYHFSDDQSYDLEPDIEAEAPKAPLASKTATTPPAFSRYRRVLIGIGAFFVVLFIVYKLIVPSTPTTTPDFSTTAATTTETKTTMKPVVKTMAQPASAVIPVQQPNPMAAPTISQPTSFPVNNSPNTQPLPQSASMAPPAAAPMPQMPSASTMPSSTQPPASLEMPNQQQSLPTAPAPITGSVTDRLANVELQNAKIQSEYAQKLADSQAENVALQTRVGELTTRLANIEATLSQLTQSIMSRRAPAPVPSTSMQSTVPVMPAMPMARGSEPKMIYTVQAIIPGRAWLKSDSGDTVTVAEGDILKDYGRITKIDPYDGIVEIDTGGKTISLSYGSGGD